MTDAPLRAPLGALPPRPAVAAGAPDLSVIVPTFNERDNVLVLFQRLAEALDGVAWEAIFVDDDSPDGILLSHESPAQELELWARGRILYFCCPETASGPLFDKLLAAGARTVVGFTGRPCPATSEGKFYWRQLDQELVTCALHDQLAPGFERARQQFLERVGTRLAGLPPGVARDDLARMMDVLLSMVIKGGEKA